MMSHVVAILQPDICQRFQLFTSFRLRQNVGVRDVRAACNRKFAVFWV